MDPAPIWPNLKTFPWQSFRGCVDILTGGYPCQPFSAAGKRQGADDPRHLWPYIARGIRILQPRICFFENVEGHISLGLSDVIEDLAGMGYRTTWGIFSASEVGAPHQRKRVFILAVASGLGSAAGLSGPFPRHEGQSGESDDGGGQAAWPSRPGEQQYGWEPPRVVSSERSLGRDIDGPAGRLGYAELCVTCDNRTDELRLLGNGVVPATAELAYRTLARELLQNPS
jgi:DNA (cytosine-5)-methyltransferase 1